MIEQKTTDGHYVMRDPASGVVAVVTREELERQRTYLTDLPVPSDAELIEVGRQHHLYYQRDQFLAEVEAKLSEIAGYERR